MNNTLIRQHAKQQDRRFTGAPLTGFGDIDDERLEQERRDLADEWNRDNWPPTDEERGIDWSNA